MAEIELKKVFRCIHCEKPFIRESWYRRHMCKKKEKFSRATNLDQIKALKLFNSWRRQSGFAKRGKDVDMSAFQKSPYAKLFLDLVEWTNANWTVTAFKYLGWLIQHNVPAHNWCTDRSLKNFREFSVTHDDHMRQTENTFHFIRDYCATKDWAINEFFRKIGLGDAMHLIETYKISPWVLLGFDAAVLGLMDRFDHEQTLTLDERISLSYWLEQIEADPVRRAEINAYCVERFREGQ